MVDFMQRAIDLAARVDPHVTMPNPRVGCVVVCDGETISEGAHLRYGEAHAEVLALDKIVCADEIYITLEPCDHFHGKQTPSCTELIIQSKPKKIFVGALDPKFQGKNLKKIKSAGIDVEYLDHDACYDLNPFLDKYHSQSPYPYVCLKIAQSLNGKTTSSDQYITNEISRQKVHETRAQYGALLTSTETIFQDEPQLNVRLCEGSDPQVFVVGTRDLETEFFHYQTRDLDFVLRDLKFKKIDSVLVEVGQTLNTEFLKQGLVDEVQIFIAPVFLGAGEKAAFATEINLGLFNLVKQADLGGDVWLSYARS